jgi:PD-(D/E)XK nuclease superfamily
MSASLSPKFLTDLADVFATLRPSPLSAAFLADLEKVYDALPTTSDADFRDLAERFRKWRTETQEFVRTRRAELHEDDPLLCRISLFRTMDSGRLEVAHTQTLAWLLDPRKDEEHGFGNTLLAALLRWYTGHDHFDRVHVEDVVPEYPLEGSAGQGRLDVLAKGTWERVGERVRWLLVIEAKVDAWEGKRQLDKYDEWLRSHAGDREIYRVFLTADGRGPESGCDEWKPMRFLKLVQIFRTVYGGLRDAPGFHFLRFYLAGVLQDVCRLPCNVREDAPDPYAVASYLKTVHDSHSEVASHDATR